MSTSYLEWNAILKELDLDRCQKNMISVSLILLVSISDKTINSVLKGCFLSYVSYATSTKFTHVSKQNKVKVYKPINYKKVNRITLLCYFNSLTLFIVHAYVWQTERETERSNRDNTERLCQGHVRTDISTVRPLCSQSEGTDTEGSAILNLASACTGPHRALCIFSTQDCF